MNLSRHIYYLRYLFKATDQHGVHSPFVYELLCESIHQIPKNSSLYDYENSIAKYLNKKYATKNTSPEMLQLKNFSPLALKEIQWAFIPNIHKNKIQFKKWLSLTEDKNIQISLDCWSFGLIFTKKDQEKEHFTLLKRRWR